MRVWFLSPLFGEVTGIVALPPDRGILVIRDHSVTEEMATIPLEWVIRVEEGA